jgi:hypothetical protein
MEPKEQVRGLGGGGGILTLVVTLEFINPMDANVEAAAVLSITLRACRAKSVQMRQE